MDTINCVQLLTFALMREQILNLEKTSRLLEPSPTLRADWTKKVTQYSDDFIDNIEDLKAYVISEENGRELLNSHFHESGREIDEVLQILKENVDSIGLNPASGGHLGYIPGGGIYTTALGDFLAAVTNRYAGIFYGGPGAVRVENQLIRWMNGLIGYPEGSLGNLTSGGSIANLIAIVTARDKKQIRSRDVENAVIYLTEQVHHCVQKAIRIAGLNESVIRYIPMDENYRMSAEALKKQVDLDRNSGLRPFLVVGSAGTTDAGAIDPLEAIADISEANDMWFHVDAAYGGFFILVDSLKERFKGVERSDSLAIDPHKGLFLSYGLGAILIKDVKAQFESHYYKASYMQDTLGVNEELSPADLSPELTKHFRGLRLWLGLHLFGLNPFKACLEEKYLLCQYFYEEIQKLGFEVGPQPELSVCMYRYVPQSGDANDFNAKLVEHVKKDGRVFISSTNLNGVNWLRLAVLSFRTRLSTIVTLIEVLEEGINKYEN